MLLFLRCLLLFIFTFLICFFGIFYCLCNPRNPRNVFIFSHLFGYFKKILGVKIELRQSSKAKKYQGAAIYIANHQSYYDIIVASGMVQPNTVTIGKKSLLYIPFFGLLYWLAGNFTINRNNKKKAINKIKEIIQYIEKKKFLFGFFQKEQEV